MEIPIHMMAGLFAVGAIAGFVDAIAGGGGLLTLPSLLLAGLPPHEALGTNKGQGVFGTAMSLGRFSASPLLDRKRAIISFVPGLVGAAAGVLLVLEIGEKHIEPLIMMLLGAVALFMIFYRPRPPHEPRRQRPVAWSILLAAAVAATFGFYDGFFGPGTGTFVIMAYVWLWHDPLDEASANAKVVNFASNLASMATFAALGYVRWLLAAPMAAGQLVGSYLGAHVTIRHGKAVVRYAVILVSLALIARLAWKMMAG